jgi:5-methylcytosine-specific restriction endonuclease McrA
VTLAPATSEQRCGRCKATKPLDDFSPSYRGKTGTWCRPCFAEYHRHRNAGTTPPPPAAHEPRTCTWCGSSYTPTQLKGAAAYCSSRCKNDDRKANAKAERLESKPERACVHCGTAMPPETRVDATFCSKECNSAAHNVTRKMAKRAGRPRRDGALVERAYLADRDGHRCGLCGDPLDLAVKHPDPAYASIDHVVPLAQGGGNDLANLQLAHLRCNLSKRDRPRGEQLRLVG